jgi:hypothetical protein
MEQTLRDIRFAAIYEGTTVMQAIDFLERRLIRDPRGFDVFCNRSTGPVTVAFASLVEEERESPPMAFFAQDGLR